MEFKVADGKKTTKTTSLVKHTTKLAVPYGSRRTRKRRKTGQGNWKKRRKYRAKREKRKKWTKKERRAYQRALSGIRVARILGVPLRVMTLTSAPGACWEYLNRDFEKLKKRVRREYGKFEYFKVRTNEGYGVLHILYRGTYIEHEWLKDNWSEVHGDSYIVYLQLVRWGEKRLAGYVVSQYIAGQGFTRQSWSWKWVFKGFVKLWKKVVRRWGGENLDKAIAEWKKILSQHCFKQVSIYEFLEEHPPPSWRSVTEEWWQKSNKCSTLKS